MPEEIQKVLVKVITLDWHGHSCGTRHNGIILGLELNILNAKIIFFR